MRKIFFSLVFLFFFLTIINAQKTYVPDDNFEQALIDLGIDTDGIVNDSVLTSDISEYRNLDVHWKQIRDLTGIKDFKNLKNLKCSSNQLTSLDLGKKDSLIYLYCRGNDLISLNVSECGNLKIIDADYNDLHNIDVSNNPDLEILNLSFGNRIGFFGNIIDVSNNLKLKRLDCQSNGLDTLDVRNNTALEQLYCSGNKLTSLDLSANTSLEHLWVDGNQITNLELTFNTSLIQLQCGGNPLESLDLTDNNKLVTISCGGPHFSSLDVSHIYSLRSLACYGQYLTSLNVKNGNNSLIYQFSAVGSPSLFCIKVDNAEKANAGLAPYQNWRKDDAATYSEDCVQNTTVEDSEFEQALIDLGIDTDGEVNGSVTVENISEITSLDLSSKGITDLTGIEAFFNLKTLIVNDNELTSLDVSTNTALTYLDCSNNLLTSLDLSNNLSLMDIDVSGNPLTSLILPTYSPPNEAPDPLQTENSMLVTSLANNTLLYLNISNTDLTSIDVSNFESLDSLDVQGSQLDSLDVSGNGNLSYLNTTNTALTCIQISQSQLDNIPTGWVKDDATSYAVDCQAASGIEDEMLAASIRLYPNPVSDILTIESEIRLTKVEIYSIVGTKILEIYSDFNAIPVNDLSNGMYILRIHSKTGFSIKKFTKE